MRSTFRLLTTLIAFILLGGQAAQAQNLAYNKTTTASSATQPAANATDSNGNTRWESASSDPQYLMVDLGTVQPIDRVKISWENAYGKNFTIQVSADGTTWTTVATVTNNSTTYNEFANLGASGRYVKMAGTARATSYGYSIYEFEVYNYSNSSANNLALGNTATASSTQGGFPASQAYDGSTTTRWGSSYNDNQWIYVDLGRTATIERVNLIWETAYGKDFRIDVSDDAATWTTIATVTNNSVRNNELGNLAGTGRYVRMYGLTRGTGYGFSLYEMEVYGAYVARPLPVELTSFQATAAGAGVRLTWTTASERNSRGFAVERSGNGREFVQLAWVAGAGTSQTAHTYTYHDATPTSAISYYRLRQVDADGTATYTAIQTVRLATVAAPVAAFPNPTTDQTTISWAASETAATSWTLTNALGQPVATAPLPAAAAFTLDLRSYQPGTYYLTLLANGRVLSRTKVQKVN